MDSRHILPGHGLMRFSRQRALSRQDRRVRKELSKYYWREWFAWYPVKSWDKENWLWMEKVDARAHCWSVWEYHAIK